MYKPVDIVKNNCCFFNKKTKSNQNIDKKLLRINTIILKDIFKNNIEHNLLECKCNICIKKKKSLENDMNTIISFCKI